jgi:hypothetical protein
MSDWKFDLDEVGPEAEEEEAEPEEWLPPIEPGRPTLENVIPFLAGVGLALYIFLQLV